MSDDITVLHGDCLDVLPTLDAGSVDIVITSPPYNLSGSPWPPLSKWNPAGGGSRGQSLWQDKGEKAGGGIRYGEHDDGMPHEAYVAWQQAILRECWRLLADDGAIFYNHKPRVIGGRLWLPLELNPGLLLRQIIIWARAGGINFNATAYLPTHEWILVLAKPEFRLRDKSASSVGDVWQIYQENKNPHPAPFPLELPRRILATTKAGNGVVLDPFGGSGTTGVACLKSGRRCILIEKDARYIPIIRRRLRDAATPLFAEPP